MVQWTLLEIRGQTDSQDNLSSGIPALNGDITSKRFQKSDSNNKIQHFRFSIQHVLERSVYITGIERDSFGIFDPDFKVKSLVILNQDQYWG